MNLLLSVLLAATTALASPSAVEQAEYYRLADEMHRLAARDAWSGVERAYDSALRTGVSLRFDDHLRGAHAAAARGEVTLARERLLAANRLHEDRTVIDWLFAIDSHYGRVQLSGGEPLEVRALPFDPAARRAFNHARELLGQSGHFEGLLPVGAYTFGSRELKVVADRNKLVEISLPPASKRRRR